MPCVNVSLSLWETTGREAVAIGSEGARDVCHKRIANSRAGQPVHPRSSDIVILCHMHGGTGSTCTASTCSESSGYSCMTPVRFRVVFRRATLHARVFRKHSSGSNHWTGARNGRERR